MDINILIETAKKARENAYAPYSNYKVGCALLSKSGKIFSGCNIENDGIMSICAERVAFCKAISEGEKDFKCILVLGGKKDLEYTSPCVDNSYLNFAIKILKFICIMIRIKLIKKH